MNGLTSITVVCMFSTATALAEAPGRSRDELIRTAVKQLVEMQEEGGMWPYEGVYRVGGEIPVGYRVGGTSIVLSALLHATGHGDKAVDEAFERGLDFVLTGLGDRLMAPSREDRYDVRVWGHAYALDFLCQLSQRGRAGSRKTDVEAWLPRLVETLISEQLDDGGWNYANRRMHASFVTAPVVQALLRARAIGLEVPDAVLRRGGRVLVKSRTDQGAFFYSGSGANARGSGGRAKVPGSIARSPICESTLVLLGAGSTDAIQAALDAFHKHWDELEKRRKKHGTHKPPYGIAPYYFYYAHRYAAQAATLLPEPRREAERKRLLDVILRTRDADGTWNDRVFARSRNFGSAMIVLALLTEDAPPPPRVAIGIQRKE